MEILVIDSALVGLFVLLDNNNDDQLQPETFEFEPPSAMIIEESSTPMNEVSSTIFDSTNPFAQPTVTGK